MLLYEIVDIFAKKKLPYAIVGGYAMALHGAVRATMDVDLVLHLKLNDFVNAEVALAAIGLQSRLPVRAQDIIKMRKEYIENRNLLAWSFVDYKNPSRQVDILIHKELNKIKVKKLAVAGRKIPVATLEELIRMKIEAGRDQDLLDVEMIRSLLNEKK